jgi:hypothetical protein
VTDATTASRSRSSAPRPCSRSAAASVV